MSRDARRALFLAAAAGLGALLLWGLAGLPDFGRFHGRYGNELVQVAVPERHTTDVVTAVVFDYRGFDTMGEELILFAAAIGTALLLRDVREEAGRALRPPSSEALGVAAAPIAGGTVLLGVFVSAYGYVTPGGGFQGGVVLAGALALVYLAAGFRAYRQVSPTRVVDLAEGAGAGGFVAIGIATVAGGSAFLENVLPLGKAGTLLAAGTIPLLNAATATAVAAAFAVVLTEFLEEVEARDGGAAR